MIIVAVSCSFHNHLVSCYFSFLHPMFCVSCCCLAHSSRGQCGLSVLSSLIFACGFLNLEAFLVVYPYHLRNTFPFYPFTVYILFYFAFTLLALIHCLLLCILSFFLLVPVYFCWSFKSFSEKKTMIFSFRCFFLDSLVEDYIEL